MKTNKNYEILFTKNEAIEMMHDNNAKSLRRIAKFAKDREMNSQEIIDFLIDAADQIEAQSMVVNLRDKI